MGMVETGIAARAGEVAAVAARCADEAERMRRPHPEAVEALVRAGFARYFVPARFGGDEAGFRELGQAVGLIGESCPATAWCASLAANLARIAAYLPEPGCREIWDQDQGPDAFVVGSLAPTGRGAPASGGWRVSGSWPYISAVDYSDWALVCAVVPDGSGAVPKVFAVPRAHYRVVESWSSTGMRATGSHTLVLEDVFVPEDRAFERADLLAGRPASSTASCHTVPLEAANGLSFVTPVLGAARGMLALWSTQISKKLDGVRPAGPGPSKAGYAAAFARSSTEIDAAGLLLARAAEVADLGDGGTPQTTTRNLRDCSVAVDLLLTAANRLFRTAGTSGQSTDSVLQRLWRDVNSASTHVAVQFESAANSYAEHWLWTS
jgi:two-component flavin-dependent monooxygenase/oxygenase LndZ5